MSRAVLSAPSVAALADAVERRFGLRLLPQRHASLADAALGLVAAGQARSMEDVRARVSGGLEVDPVVVRMREAASIGETYFWRAPEQLLALREKVLTHVVEPRRARGGRHLRVWSAGCATGEEAYTLAHLLRTAVPDFTVQVVGTDMNEASLRTAREGRYRRRSLRGEALQAMAGALVQVEDGWQVSEALRRDVSFLPHNLVTERLPDAERGLAGFDVVVCRNVLIYVDPERLPRVMAGLAAAASPRCVLAVTPAEYRAAPHLPGFRDAGRALFLRGAADAAAPRAGRGHRPLPRAQEARAAGCAPSLPPHDGFAAQSSAHPVGSQQVSPQQVLPPPGRGVGAGAAASSPLRAAAVEEDVIAALQAARDAADRGELPLALTLALAVEARFPLSPLSAHLLATVRAAQGDDAGALRDFRRALVLAPHFVAAALGSGLSLLRLGRGPDARQQLEATLEALEAASPEALLPGMEVRAAVARRLAHEALAELEDGT